MKLFYSLHRRRRRDGGGPNGNQKFGQNAGRIRAKCGKNSGKIRAKIRAEKGEKLTKIKKRQKKIRASSLEKKGNLIVFLNQ